MIKVAPSILAADPLHMGRDVRKMADAGCDMIHVDVMDGHFVPNLSYGPALVKALRKEFDLPLDVHLMIDNPEKYVDVFAEAGADILTIHAEIPGNAGDVLRQIRAKGIKAGLSLKPDTGADAVRDLLPCADLLLVMTVEPGFGGQSFRPGMVMKLREARALGYRGLLEADGGVSLDNLPMLGESGLDVAVMGTAMYRSAAPAEDMARIHRM